MGSEWRVRPQTRSLGAVWSFHKSHLGERVGERHLSLGFCCGVRHIKDADNTPHLLYHFAQRQPEVGLMFSPTILGYATIILTVKYILNSH